MSLYESSMLKVLKWMDPAKKPRIVLGPKSYINEPQILICSTSKSMKFLLA